MWPESSKGFGNDAYAPRWMWFPMDTGGYLLETASDGFVIKIVFSSLWESDHITLSVNLYLLIFFYLYSHNCNSNSNDRAVIQERNKGQREMYIDRQISELIDG